jgi:drug/metabolite transporter (DMT)-like permease
METGMTTRDWLLLILLSVLWGGSFFFIGVAVQALPAFTIVAIRVGLAMLVLLAVLRVLRIALPADGRIWLAFLGMGLLNNAVPFTLFVWAQAQVPSGLASILNATTPISTALVAHVFTSDEKLTPNRLLGVLLGLAGVAVMLGPDLLSGLGDNLLAQGACLLATLSYAFAGVYGRRFRRLGLAPLVTATGQLTVSAALMLPLALLIDRPWLLPLPGWQAMAALIGLAVLSTALAYVIFFRIMTTAGSNVNLVTLLVPVSAILLGVLVLGETLLPRHLIGFGVIALGLAAIDGRLIAVLRRRAPHSG